MTEEMEMLVEIIQEAEVVPEETPEHREERLKREDYARRWHQAAIEREDILRRNGVIGPDDKLDMDLEAAIRQRCCF